MKELFNIKVNNNLNKILDSIIICIDDRRRIVNAE